jgi:acyl carrier protein
MRDEIAVLSDYVRSESGYKGDLDPGADLLESKILDSFSVVQLVVFVQQRFNVEFEAEDLTRANLATLSSIVALIDKRKVPAGK